MDEKPNGCSDMNLFERQMEEVKRLGTEQVANTLISDLHNETRRLRSELDSVKDELEDVVSERDKLLAQLMQQSIETGKLLDSIFILTRTNADLLARMK